MVVTCCAGEGSLPGIHATRACGDSVVTRTSRDSNATPESDRLLQNRQYREKVVTMAATDVSASKIIGGEREWETYWLSG